MKIRHWVFRKSSIYSWKLETEFSFQKDDGKFDTIVCSQMRDVFYTKLRFRFAFKSLKFFMKIRGLEGRCFIRLLLWSPICASTLTLLFFFLRILANARSFSWKKRRSSKSSNRSNHSQGHIFFNKNTTLSFWIYPQ